MEHREKKRDGGVSSAAATKARLAAIVELSSDAIIAKDLDGLITDWNQGAEKIFGYTEQEMVGAPISRLIPPDRKDEENFIQEKIRQGERVDHFETIRRRKDGRLIPISVTISPLKDEAGNIIGASKIARDITQQKAHELELARMMRLYDALSQVNQAIVWMPTRVKLFEQVCRVLVKHGGFRMAWVGLPEATTGRLVPVASFGEGTSLLEDLEIRLDDHPAGRGPVGLAYQTNHPQVCNEIASEASLQPWQEKLTGQNFQSLAGFPIREAKQVCGILTVYSDEPDFFQDKEVALLTEAAGDVSFALDNFAERDRRQIAEQDLRELNQTLEHKVDERTSELQQALVRAEAADRLKSAFLATMSHELRTPLNSIIGFTGIVLHRMAGPLTDEQAKQLGMVRDSARHLLELINDVLDISKIEAGQLEVRLEAFSFKKVLERVLAMMLPLAQKKALKLECPGELEVDEVISDRRRVEQILLNLVNNAVKFTDVGCVRIQVVRVTRHERSWLRLSVLDTGCGIRPEDMALLFLPFRQIDSGPSRQHEGTGLGLAICRRLAGLLGGEIQATSEWQQGSEFTLLLPLDPPLRP